jgi:hypothetical protein
MVKVCACSDGGMAARQTINGSQHGSFRDGSVDGNASADEEDADGWSWSSCFMVELVVYLVRNPIIRKRAARLRNAGRLFF